MTTTAAAAARLAPPAGGAPFRVTWVQPEDLLGHELRQAAEDGRDAAGVARRWRAAGGAPAPDRAGASPGPADPALRPLALALLDELAALPSPLAADEPNDLTDIQASCEQGELTVGRSVVDDRVLTARLEAAWLGRAAGCLLGKPVEKLPLHGIRALARSTGNWPLHSYFTAAGLDPTLAARYPWNRRSRATSLVEHLDGMPEDDDLNYPLLGLLLLERHGHGFVTSDVARLWLDELPAGRAFTAERVAYRNLLDGIEPPHTARYRNPFREWIGAQIRADVFGWTRPGDPAAAAAAAWRDATLSHTANGVYAAMFTAAALAEAAGGNADVHGALRAGLAVVPPWSRLARAVRLGITAARDEPTGTPEGFATVVDRLHTAYRHHHWVHAVPNAALLAAALTHADGDFSGSICRVVSGGWDTDSNGATAGSLTGLLAGSPAALPDRWTAPLGNRLATGVGGLDGIGFDALARRTAALVVRTPDAGTPGLRTTDARTTGVPTPDARTPDIRNADRPEASAP
ncbi:ADP-ribosylglycohydrolase family protein [Streptomyces sp. NPDC048506]|uniref:ADP-ribosylglycohydrolase family protein n=1 Tax=Streptomyces sp. NPDC048506 TaxID=3155028 RepID=UPI00342EDBB1